MVLIYLAIACCNGTGDVLLKRGMDDLGADPPQQLDAHLQRVY